jgi:Ca-activated chloride channel family protein
MIRANYALDYDLVSTGHAQRLYLMAYLATDADPAARPRRPLNISLVVDRSGSMAGNKIDYTRQAAQLLVQNLTPNDTFSVVLYNDNVETLLPPERVQRKDAINQQIRSIKPGGTTNLSGGWLQGCEYVAQHKQPDQMNRVILMTDGLANRGVTNAERLIAIAQQKFGEGVSTTTMGLGTDFNEDLLMSMANAGGGAFYFIESPEVAPLIFQEELQGLLNVVGQNLVISVEPTDKVADLQQLNAYPMERNDRRVSFRLGDVFANEMKALLIEISLKPFEGIGRQQIVNLRFEYDEVENTTSRRRVYEQPVMLQVVDSSGVEIAPFNREVRRSVLLLKAAQARRNAVEMADKGLYNKASIFLRDALKAIDEAGFVDPQLVEERTALQKQASSLDDGGANYDDYSRKLMSAQAYYTMSSRHEDTMVLRIRESERESSREQPIDRTMSKREPSVSSLLAEDKIQTNEFYDTPGSAPVDVPPVSSASPAVPPSTPKAADGPAFVNKTGPTPRHARWQGKTFNLQGDLIRIGRSNENDIVLPIKGVSRFHAELHRRSGQLVLIDKGSTNGTLCNGQTLSSGGQVLVVVGDVAQFCDEKLEFLD